MYNRSRYIAAFESMKSAGFNIARVFLDELPDRGIGGATNSTEALDSAWVDRLAQFISDAEERGIYTLVTMVYCPDNAYFRAIRHVNTGLIRLCQLVRSYQFHRLKAMASCNHFSFPDIECIRYISCIQGQNPAIAVLGTILEPRFPHCAWARRL